MVKHLDRSGGKYIYKSCAESIAVQKGLLLFFLSSHFASFIYHGILEQRETENSLVLQGSHFTFHILCFTFYHFLSLLFVSFCHHFNYISCLDLLSQKNWNQWHCPQTCFFTILLCVSTLGRHREYQRNQNVEYLYTGRVI